MRRFLFIDAAVIVTVIGVLRWLGASKLAGNHSLTVLRK